MRPLLRLGLATSAGFSQAKPDPAKAGTEVIAEATGSNTGELRALWSITFPAGN